jgi:7-carboxy-7-deazaguanine synthase
MDIGDIMSEIQQWDCNLVEVTGGEPLFQEGCIDLLNALVISKYEVMLETGGSISISDVPKNVIKIVDFKCPSSGMEKKNLWSIVDDLRPHDEVKFVIGNREDFYWAKNRIEEYSLDKICTLLFSPTFGEIDPQQIVEWILAENLPVRIQMQMHKMIWSPEEKGV